MPAIVADYNSTLAALKAGPLSDVPKLG